MTLLLIRLSLQGGGLDDVSLDEPEGGGLGFPSIYSEVIWESRYVSEGRDYLEGGGSITGFMSIGYDGAALDTSFREGIDPKYSELNIGPSYEYAFEDFVASAYYYHLRFLREDLNDHEVGVGQFLGSTQDTFQMPMRDQIIWPFDWMRITIYLGIFSSLATLLRIGRLAENHTSVAQVIIRSRISYGVV